MPKVKYTGAKGLFEQKGSGVDFSASDAAVTMRRKVISFTGDTTLTSADSGAIIYLSQSATATTLTLPTAANAGEGWYANVILATPNAGAIAIDAQAATMHQFVLLADGGTDSNAGELQTKRKLILSGNTTTANTEVEIFCDGTNYFATGFTGTKAELAFAES